jgi:phenylpropionate dioxygenase-like ring-hydroxylating dioxygenase large terminal subunit
MPAHPDQKPSAKAVVKTYHAQVCYDFVWVCLGEPQHEIPPFPEWQDSTFRRVLCGPYPLKSAGQRMIENFLDVAHFPWVHENILGARDRAEIGDYEVVSDESGVAGNDIQVYQPNPDGTRVGKLIHYYYKVHRPLIAYFRKESTGPRFAMMLMMTPVEPAQSVIWQWMLMNHSYDTPEEELLAFQDEIVYQDLPVVESQRPGLLPLDLQVELHLRSDKMAIAYRQWLNKLGVRFGMV